MSSSQSRRQFLRYSSALALSQLPWLNSSCVTTSVSQSRLPPEAWTELEKNLKGPVLRPGDMGFDKLTSTWNLRYKNVQKPEGIARCKDAEDIKVSLQWAQSHKLPLVARSGGHSYAGYSTTPGLMIDLSLQNWIEFDDRTGKATVGAGARNATLYSNLPAKKASVTHGRCMEVGVGGLVLGGGIGFNMRLHGLLIDQLEATDLITASGKTLHCSPSENRKVFWACQGGGGGNFGINSSFSFQTFPVGDVTVFDLTWNDKLDDLLPAALDLLPGTPDKLGAKLSVVKRAKDPMAINLLGQLVGTQDELLKLLAPLFKLAEPSKRKILTLPYWQAQKELTEAGDKEYSHERSHYGYGTMSADGCRAILRNMRAWPGTQALTTWKMFLVGGAISRVPARDTAYWHRGASMCTSIELNWLESDPDELVEKNEMWLADFHKEMAHYTSHHSYQNFIDNAQTNYLRAYYGGNLEQLVEVKNMVDPGNVFSYPQSIPLKLTM